MGGILAHHAGVVAAVGGGGGFDPEAGLSITRSHGPGSISAYSSTERGQNIVFAMDIPMPSSLSDAQAFEMGAGAIGCGVFLRETSGTPKLRFRAGNGVSVSGSTDNCAVLDLTDFPQGGGVHTIVFEFRINPGRVRVWIDGVFKGSGDTIGGGALRNEFWAGTNAGGYLSGFGSNCSGEPDGNWHSASGASVLRVYVNQLVNA